MLSVCRDDTEGLVYRFTDANSLHESEAHEALPMMFERASGKCGEWVFIASGPCDMLDPLGQYGYIGVAWRGTVPAVRDFVGLQTRIVKDSPEVIGPQWIAKAEAWIRGEFLSDVRHDVMGITRSMFR